MNKPMPALNEYVPRTANWKSGLFRLLIGVSVLLVVVWLGWRAGHEIKAMESWIAGHGVVGWIVFVLMIIVFTSVFVPDTLLAFAAGVLFGLTWGTVLTVVGSILTAAFNFLAARRLLRPRIEAMLAHHPKLRAIQVAAQSEGLRLQILLRLVPINAASVSYVMGASGARFSTFMLATIGLIPGLFCEVYFGYLACHISKVAGNVSDHSTFRTVVTVVGFVFCIVLMVFISRVATKAIAETQRDSATS